MPDRVDGPEIDRPDVVAEVRAAFLAYEAALVAHDLDALDTAFWDDPRVIRYGVAEMLDYLVTFCNLYVYSHGLKHYVMEILNLIDPE